MSPEPNSRPDVDHSAIALFGRLVAARRSRDVRASAQLRRELSQLGWSVQAAPLPAGEAIGDRRKEGALFR